jgi:hypothetical protein
LHRSSFTPSDAVDEISNDPPALIVLFLLRVPCSGTYQHALPDMIFWLTSASDLNHVLSTLQSSCDLSIGDTASTMPEPRMTAECIDRYEAGLSYCVPAPSLRRVIDRSLTAKMKLVFTFFRAPSYLWLHLFPTSKRPRTPQRSQAITLHAYQRYSSGYAAATCGPLVLYSPASCPLSAWKKIRRCSPEPITHP